MYISKEMAEQIVKILDEEKVYSAVGMFSYCVERISTAKTFGYVTAPHDETVITKAALSKADWENFEFLPYVGLSSKLFSEIKEMVKKLILAAKHAKLNQLMQRLTTFKSLLPDMEANLHLPNKTTVITLPVFKGKLDPETEGRFLRLAFQRWLSEQVASSNDIINFIQRPDYAERPFMQVECRIYLEALQNLKVDYFEGKAGSLSLPSIDREINLAANALLLHSVDDEYETIMNIVNLGLPAPILNEIMYRILFRGDMAKSTQDWVAEVYASVIRNPNENHVDYKNNRKMVHLYTFMLEYYKAAKSANAKATSLELGLNRIYISSNSVVRTYIDTSLRYKVK